MKNSKHCQKRMQQRGRKALDIRVIEKYGEYSRGVGYLLSRRRAKVAIARLRRWLQGRKNYSPLFAKRVAQVRQIVGSLEKTVGWMLVCTSGKAITVYSASKKRQQKFMRGQCRPTYNTH